MAIQALITRKQPFFFFFFAPIIFSLPSPLLVSSSPAVATIHTAALRFASSESFRNRSLSRHSHTLGVHSRPTSSSPYTSTRRYLEGGTISNPPAPAPVTDDDDEQNSSITPSAPSPAAASVAAPTKSGSKKKPRAVRWLVGIALGMATGFVSAMILSVAFRFIRNCMRKNKEGKPVVYQRSIDAKSVAFLQKEDAFQGLELLGRGASGAVYKAVLQVSSRRRGEGGGTQTKTVAVKKVTGSGMAKAANYNGGSDGDGDGGSFFTRNSAQIYAEMETLGKVRHRNLVTLLAYIPASNAHILIYDFMENGSLDDALKRCRQGEMELPWKARLDIAIGVAMGLKYLHYDAKPRIIHRDLKPGNILLDEKMEAKIGDFGLAMAMADTKTHVTGSNWAGTLGYAAPEYGQTMKYTAMGDVFSFGVVMVVLLTGRQPTDDMFADVVPHMGAWVSHTLAAGPDHAIASLDPCLLLLPSHGDGFHDLDQILLALKIASFCLHPIPSSRPSIKDVLLMLQQLRLPPPHAAHPHQPLPTSATCLLAP